MCFYVQHDVVADIEEACKIYNETIPFMKRSK